MEFAWVGLERLSRGERWPVPPVELRRATSSTPPTRHCSALVAVAATASGARSRSARSRTAPPGWRERSMAAGVRRGDVVMTLVGQPPRVGVRDGGRLALGAVAQPCTEQLRPADLRARMERWTRARWWLTSATPRPSGPPGFGGPVLVVPDERLFDAEPAPAAELDPRTRRSIVFTSGTPASRSRSVTGTRYLAGQRVQAEHWFGARPGELCWCTAASGWSKSARNVFVAPWLRGAAALLHDARFDPEERLRPGRARAAWTCSAWRPPSTGRSPSARGCAPLPALRHAVAAGEPLNPEIVERVARAAGVAVHDGYGQTETGALTGMPIGAARAARVDGPRRCPASGSGSTTASSAWTRPPCPTFFLDGAARAARGAPATACARTTTATSGSRAAPTT